jgi:hypothetical protein
LPLKLIAVFPIYELLKLFDNVPSQTR